MRPILALALLLATPAAAQDEPHCDSLWFVRNLLYDRAGYCFTSPLGEAMFDNRGCTTSTPVLSDRDRAVADEIRAIEAREACSVDTRRTSLPDDGLFAIYRMIEDVPIPDRSASGCMGYRGARMFLRSGARPTAPATGEIAPGDNLSFAHLPRDGWEFVTVHPPEGLPVRGWGWARLSPERLVCDNLAG